MPDFKSLTIQEAQVKTGCLIELKIDGSRMRYSNGVLQSERDINRNARYSHVLQEVSKINWSVRGEMSIPNGNVHQLNKKENWSSAKFYIFDLYEIQGKDVSQLPLLDRRTMIEDEMQKMNFKHLLVPTQFKTFDLGWDYVKSNNAEGLVLKDLNNDWKCKLLKEEKVKIVGHVEGKSKGAFLIDRNGVCGKVSGTSQAFVDYYWKLVKDGKQVYAEVEYAFVTDAGILFQPRLRRVGTLDDLKYT